jgi:hypothetical protein
MENQQELTKAKLILKDVYQRFRNGEINKDQAKCESDLLVAIIKTIEMSELKDQIKHLTALLTNNKKK